LYFGVLLKATVSTSSVLRYLFIESSLAIGHLSRIRLVVLLSWSINSHFLVNLLICGFFMFLKHTLWILGPL